MSEKRKLTEMAVYQALILGVLALCAALLMGLGNMFTEGPIQERLKEDLMASLTQVIPPEIHDNDLLASPVMVENRTIYQAKKDGVVQAVAFSAEGKGYGGTVTLIMGVDRDGRVLGVRVISHTETPGLGDKIEILKAKWIESFSGLMLGDPPEEKWAVKKDGGIFDQFSGATITPRAVVTAVKDNLKFFLANKSLILTEAKP